MLVYLLGIKPLSIQKVCTYLSRNRAVYVLEQPTLYCDTDDTPQLDLNATAIER